MYRLVSEFDAYIVFGSHGPLLSAPPAVGTTHFLWYDLSFIRGLTRVLLYFLSLPRACSVNKVPAVHDGVVFLVHLLLAKWKTVYRVLMLALTDERRTLWVTANCKCSTLLLFR